MDHEKVHGDLLEKLRNEDQDSKEIRCRFMDLFEKQIGGEALTEAENASLDSELYHWHLSDVFWAADALADICGKEVSIKVLTSLVKYISNEQYWEDREAEQDSQRLKANDHVLHIVE